MVIVLKAWFVSAMESSVHVAVSSRFCDGFALMPYAYLEAFNLFSFKDE